MRRNKKLLAAGAVSMLLAATTACGGDSDGSTGGSGGASSGTLRVLIPSFPASTEGNEALSKVIDRFNEEYPDVEVETDIATFDNLNEKITTSIAGGQPYDVYVTGVGWIPPFADKGLYADLAELGVDADALASETNESLVSAATWDDKVYAYPLFVGPKPLALSRSAFEAAGLDPEAPPTSFAELQEAASKLAGGETQQAFDFWAAPSAYRGDFVTFLGAAGEPLYADGEPNFASDAGTGALETMHKLIDEGASEFGATSPDGQPQTFTGASAMGFVGGYVDCSDKGVGQKTCDDLNFFTLQDSAEAMYCGGQLASVGANSQLKEPALAFIKGLTDPETQDDLAKFNFAVPAVSGAEDAESVTSNPASEFAYNNLDKCVFEGGTPDWLETRDAFGGALDNVLLGKEDAAATLESLANTAG